MIEYRYSYPAPCGEVEVFVDRGISDGSAWGTYYRKPNGSLKRITSLPLRQSREAAQKDLDAWAARKRLALIGGTVR